MSMYGLIPTFDTHTPIAVVKNKKLNNLAHHIVYYEDFPLDNCRCCDMLWCGECMGPTVSAYQ